MRRPHSPLVTAHRHEERGVTSGRVIVVAALGATQTVAWASSYYMPAILGAPIAKAGEREAWRSSGHGTVLQTHSACRDEES